MLAGAGELLLNPGFITDTLGFTFLTGPLRRPIAGYIIRSGVVKFMGSGARGGSFQFWPSQRNSRDSGDGNIYEGEYSEDGLSQIAPGDSNKGSEDEPR